MKSKGIDVSYHNGVIDWSELKDKIDFAMIRCGYGQNNLDKQFKNNTRGCETYNIPYGVYWFSYALNENMARQEADYCCDAVKNNNILYPIAFDFEYGSENYAKKHGINFSKEDRVKMAKAFLNRVEERGYYPLLYANEDYIKNRGYDKLIGLYDLWYARWNNKPNPARECDMWQYGGEKIGKLELVDVNWCYKDYPSIINPYYNIHDLDEQTILRIIHNSDLYYLNRDYINLAYDIINGVYGAGIERKEKVEELGFNYEIAQSVVNTILHL